MGSVDGQGAGGVGDEANFDGFGAYGRSPHRRFFSRSLRLRNIAQRAYRQIAAAILQPFRQQTRH
ncbi:MAG: hypothetical protein IPM76_20785 [Chloroflexi bacterium]|nr:hypothetical protein [Chloroflexota bacterium]